MSGSDNTLERLLAIPSRDGTDASTPLNRARKLLHDLQQNKVVVSDLVSNGEGGTEVQWVDMALGGGGILGIATAGYVYALEAAGIRFRGIVGTSAGGIVGTLTAALRGRPDARCGDALLVKVLDPEKGLKYDRVPDGDTNQKKLSELLLMGGAVDVINDVQALLAIPECLKNGGLHPGTYFKDYVKDALREVGVTTMAQLKDACKIVNNSNGSIKLMRRRGDERTPYSGVLEDGVVAVVASDVTWGKKAVLTWRLPPGILLNGYPDTDPDPDVKLVMHSSDYWADPDSVDPSEFVRCTMAVPGFFYPQKYTVAGAMLPPPGDGLVTFVDGGMVSNFPISEFHAPPEEEPVAPTFGCHIGGLVTAANPTKEAPDYVNALLNTVLVASDFSFLETNPDYKRLISYVTPQIAGITFLSFNMNQDQKKELLVDGMEAARNFLLGADRDPEHGRPKRIDPFDWQAYKDLRTQLAKSATK